MAYALVGIPLGLVMFQSIGERLNNFSSFVIRNVKRVLKYDSIEASETNLILVVTVSTFIPFYKNKILQNVDIFCFFLFLSYIRQSRRLRYRVERRPFPNTKDGLILIQFITAL